MNDRIPKKTQTGRCIGKKSGPAIVVIVTFGPATPVAPMDEESETGNDTANYFP
jgi:hypothetical protein